jgi:hypothetical protein
MSITVWTPLTASELTWGRCRHLPVGSAGDYLDAMRGWARPNGLDVVLIVALVLFVGFVWGHDRIAADSPWQSLWPNVTTDLFGLWLVARIIEGIIDQREKERAAALDVRGVLNFTMQRSRTLLPRPDDWTLRPLRDEIYWMRQRVEYQEAYLGDEERHALRAAWDRLGRMVEEASRLADSMRSVDRAWEAVEDGFRHAATSIDGHPWLHEVDELQRLERGYRRLESDASDQRGTESVQRRIHGVRSRIPELQLAPTIAHTVEEWLAAVETVLEQRAALQSLIGDYGAFVRRTEETILTRYR